MYSSETLVRFDIDTQVFKQLSVGLFFFRYSRNIYKGQFLYKTCLWIEIIRCHKIFTEIMKVRILPISGTNL